jgi:hypothetical protein
MPSVLIRRFIHTDNRRHFESYCIKLVAGLFSFILLVAISPAARAEPMAAAAVRAVLSQPESRLDFLEAAITFDRLIGKNSDVAATRALVARLEDAARQMAGPKQATRISSQQFVKPSMFRVPGITIAPSPTTWQTLSDNR